MKKLLMVLVLAGLLVVSAYSATSDSLSVTAAIAQNISVDLSSGTLAFTMDGSGASSTSTTTTTLTVISNKKNWTVSFESLNNGFLSSSTVGVDDDIPYLLQATFNEPTPAWTRTTLVNGLSSAVNPEGKTIVVTGGKTPKAGVTFTLQASILAQASTDILFEADNAYSDTVTISIESP